MGSGYPFADEVKADPTKPPCRIFATGGHRIERQARLHNTQPRICPGRCTPLCVEERLQVRRRIGRQAPGTAAPLRVLAAQTPNQRSSMDFVHDTLVGILSVVDDYTRESLCLTADMSLPSGRVIRDLEAVIARRGLPTQCVSDNVLSGESRVGR